MLAYTLRRIVMLVPVLFGVSVLVFMMLVSHRGILPDSSPGQPRHRNKSTKSVMCWASISRLYEQYYDYMSRMAHGDRRSIITHDAVTSELTPRFIATAELSGAAMVVAASWA